MALSGSTNFEPNVTEFIEEAYERCGAELRTGYDLKTAIRSVNLMLAEWANRGLNQWTIEQATQTVTEGTKARPSQFFFDKLSTPSLKIWPAPENSTDILVFNKLVRMDDADKGTNTMDMPFRFYPCFVAGLAYYLSQKKNPQLTPQLKALYEEEFRRAADQDEDRASFRVRPDIRMN
jgi:hypothetical protein